MMSPNTHNQAAATALHMSAQIVTTPDKSRDALVYTTTAAMWRAHVAMLRSLEREITEADVLLMLGDIAKVRAIMDPATTAHNIEHAACIGGAVQANADIQRPPLPAQMSTPAQPAPPRPPGVRPTVPTVADDIEKTVSEMARALAPAKN